MKNRSDVARFFSDPFVTVEAKGALAAILATDESILQKPKSHIADFIRQSSVIGRARAKSAVAELIKHGFVTTPKPNNFAALKGKAGFVYLIGPNPEKETKIGATTNIQRRLKEIQREHGECCQLIAYAPVNSMGDVEEILYRWFEHKNNHGEWYMLDRMEICRCKRVLSSCAQNQEAR